jgi:hypothetical protein
MDLRLEFAWKKPLTLVLRPDSTIAEGGLWLD